MELNEIKLNFRELHILEGVQDIFKYIARDKNGILFYFDLKPSKDQELGIWSEADIGRYEEVLCKPNLFVSIRWEDKEAWEIEKLIEHGRKQQSDFNVCSIIDNLIEYASANSCYCKCKDIAKMFKMALPVCSEETYCRDCEKIVKEQLEQLKTKVAPHHI